jgi:hypothetical protein
MRLDFGSWLASLSRHDRQIAEVLVSGKSNNRAAVRYCAITSCG